jgi:hypothetical protein
MAYHFYENLIPAQRLKLLVKACLNIAANYVHQNLAKAIGPEV